MAARSTLVLGALALSFAASACSDRSPTGPMNLQPSFAGGSGAGGGATGGGSAGGGGGGAKAPCVNAITVSATATEALSGNSFAAQTESDVAVVPAGDEVCLRQAQRGRARIVTFGPGGDVDVRDEAIVHRPSGERWARSAIASKGGHNAINASAAPDPLMATSCRWCFRSA